MAENITGMLKEICGGRVVSREPSGLCAILSGFYNRAVPDDLIVFGEVGLSGEVRSVSMAENRVQEAAKLGFHSCILPVSSAKGIKVPENMKLIPIRGIGQLAEYLREC